jgi:preprotein translocase subunit SecA
LSRALARRADRGAAQWAASQARVAANRIFALEHSGLPLLQLAAIARRELAGGPNPAQATLDSLALAAIAAQRTLGMRPHLPQLAVALLMLQDRAVEMPPGEGKTLALALTAAVRTLAGMPVHVVVREASRAREDVRTLRPFYQALGITVAALTRGSMDSAPSAAATPDVCYGQLRDLVLAASRRVHGAVPSHLPESACALVDDLDTILVDDAAHPVAVPPGTDRSVTAATTETRDEPAAAPTGQAWFARYRHLAGVSATLAEARRELEVVYGLGVTLIPSIYPSFRRDRPLQVVAGRNAWQKAVAVRVGELVRQRRTVVVAVAHADGGAALLQALRSSGLTVDVANGDATACLSGGRAGGVVVCEDPAACANIVPDPVARVAGGLAIVVTTLGETRRADRRWRQLAGRRGQPGSTEAIVALPSALGGEHAWLPAGLMRSFALARRSFLEWRASADRCRRARGRSIAPAAEPQAAWPEAAQLQHEGQ